MRKLPVSILSRYRIAALCGVGQMLELYDYTLYGVLLASISPVFFPHHNPYISQMWAMASFGLSFLFAPFGALIWGWMGDVIGRKRMIVLSLFLMAIPSFLIACLPGYAMIGWCAPLLLFFCRLLQVFSASGEVKGVKIFAMEHMGEAYWGRASALISVFGALGVILAMLMGWLVAHFKEMEFLGQEHLWRLPFLFAALLGVVGMIVRKRITESPAFIAPNQLEAPSSIFMQYQSLTRQYGREALAVFVLGGFLGELSYTMHAFMNHYLTQSVGLMAEHAFMMAIIALIATAAAAVVAGSIVDTQGTQKVITRILWFLLIFSLPLLLMLNKEIWLNTILVHIMLGGSLGVYASASSVVMVRLFPPALRCRGVMFYYALGVAIFGGMTPLLFSFLISFSYGIYYVGGVLSASAALVLLLAKDYLS